MFRKSLSKCVKFVSCDNNRVTAVILNVCVNGELSPTLLASVYMPVDVPADKSDEDFEFVCGCLNAIIEDRRVAGFIFRRP
jgi:hypothetical protein